MTPLEAAEMLNSAGVVTVHVTPDGVILGVVHRWECVTEGCASCESRRWYQPASEMYPPLREAAEVYMAWRRAQPRDPLEFGWLGDKPDAGQADSPPDRGALLRAAGFTPAQSHEGAAWAPRCICGAGDESGARLGLWCDVHDLP